MTTKTRAFDALFAIYTERGELTPAAVVDASRPSDAPLHDRFEWDDSVAGERYREVQAAEIIRSVHVTLVTDTERGPVRVRRFLATPQLESVDEPSTPWNYVPIEHLGADATAAILRQMEKDVAALRRKYRDHRAALDDLLRSTTEAAPTERRSA